MVRSIDRRAELTETESANRLSPLGEDECGEEGGERNSPARFSPSPSSSSSEDSTVRGKLTVMHIVQNFILTSKDRLCAHLDLLFSGGSWLDVDRGEEERLGSIGSLH